MAQQALGPGTAVPRRRALFGLLDADGWGWAVGQGVRLADHHHLHARLPAGPGLLPDRRPDGRPRRPRLVADQPLPADEREPALPGAGRRARAVGGLAARAEPAAAADRRLRAPGRDPDLLHRRVRRDDGPVDGLRRPDGRLRQLRQVDRGPGSARSRAPTRASSTSPAASTSSVGATRAAPRRRPPSSSAPIRRPAPWASGRRPTTWRCPSRAAGRLPRSRPTACCSSAAATPPGR